MDSAGSLAVPLGTHIDRYLRALATYSIIFHDLLFATNVFESFYQLIFFCLAASELDESAAKTGRVSVCCNADEKRYKAYRTGLPVIPFLW